VRAYLKAKGMLLRVGHDLNNKPIRKFHCALAFLNETVKLERPVRGPTQSPSRA
jgi:hypothetical protein